MTQATNSHIPSRSFFQSAGGIPSTYAVNATGWIPVIHRHPESEVFGRKVKPTAAAAIDYARRTIAYRKLRTNEAKRRLAALSDPWWVETVASMNLQPLVAHQSVNRDRTGFQGWGL
jgi:hypothetical protein